MGAAKCHVCKAFGGQLVGQRVHAAGLCLFVHPLCAMHVASRFSASCPATLREPGTTFYELLLLFLLRRHSALGDGHDGLARSAQLFGFCVVVYVVVVGVTLVFVRVFQASIHA